LNDISSSLKIERKIRKRGFIQPSNPTAISTGSGVIKPQIGKVV